MEQQNLTNPKTPFIIPLTVTESVTHKENRTMTREKRTDRLLFGLIFLCLFVAIFGLSLHLNKINNTVDELKELEQELIQENKSLKNDVAQMRTDMTDRLTEIEHNQEITDIRLKNHYSSTENETKIAKIEKQKAEQKAELTKKVTVNKGGQRGYNLSNYEIRLVAKLVYCEVGNCSYRLKKAIASVVINRARRYHKSIYQVIYEDGVFSTSWKIGRTNPSSSCISAVRDVVRNGSTLPQRVVAFRNNHYHRGFGRPYCRIENVYFSTM